MGNEWIVWNKFIIIQTNILWEPALNHHNQCLNYEKRCHFYYYLIKPIPSQNWLTVTTKFKTQNAIFIKSTSCTPLCYLHFAALELFTISLVFFSHNLFLKLPVQCMQVKVPSKPAQPFQRLAKKIKTKFLKYVFFM